MLPCAELETPDVGAFPVPENLLVWARTGSAAHNTTTQDSDEDRMGILLPPTPYLIGLKSWDHWEGKSAGYDFKLWTLHKFVRLALASNPIAMEFLWIDPQDLLRTTTGWYQLLEVRDAFSSLQAYHSFRGMIRGLVSVVDKSDFGPGVYDHKKAAHALRLACMAEEFLRTGQMKVRRDDDAELLRRVKQGLHEWETVHAWIEEALYAMTLAHAKSPLPEEPDTELIEEVLMEIVLDKLTN